MVFMLATPHHEWTNPQNSKKVRVSSGTEESLSPLSSVDTFKYCSSSTAGYEMFLNTPTHTILG